MSTLDRPAPRLLLLTGFWLSATALTQAQGSSFPAQEVDINSSIVAVIHGDWNGDGAADVASVGSHIAVSLNDGGGTLQPVSLYPGVSSLVDIVAGDIDGDGDQDLVVLDDGSNALRIYLGNGDGTFPFLTPLTVTLPALLGGASLAIADVNGDSRPDIAVATAQNTAIQLALNTGTAPFFDSAAGVTGTSVARSVELVDIDADGDLDMAWVTSGSTSKLRLKLNEGAGAFAGSVFEVATTPGANHVAAADFDGDGLVDFAASLSGPSPAVSVFVMMNQGGAVFSTRSFSASASYIAGLEVGDVDTDGDVDIALTDTDGASSSKALLLYNDGQGCFATGGCAPAGTLPSGETFNPSVVTSVGSTHDITFVDLDSDSRADMIWAGQYGTSSQTKLYVHLNDTPAQGTYPGTGEDLELLSSVAGALEPVVFSGGAVNDVKLAESGDVLRLHVRSKSGAFDYAPLVLVANVGLTGTPLPAPALPGIPLDLTSLLILESGGGALFSSPVVAPEGWDWIAPVPLGLAGMSVYLQAIAFPGLAHPAFSPALPANGSYAATDAHEFQL